MCPQNVHFRFSSSEIEYLPDSVECPLEIEDKTSETEHTSEIELRHQMAIFSHIEHISHKYPIKVTFLHK
jgi:hypothetical protein